ncbi:hypothetical protein K4G93_24505, partial [Mycobacterium tuberculosis]|nr:hypothetical protein [Mycobacterium tuberculosis]
TIQKANQQEHRLRSKALKVKSHRLVRVKANSRVLLREKSLEQSHLQKVNLVLLQIKEAVKVNNLVLLQVKSLERSHLQKVS